VTPISMKIGQHLLKLCTLLNSILVCFYAPQCVVKKLLAKQAFECDYRCRLRFSIQLLRDEWYRTSARPLSVIGPYRHVDFSARWRSKSKLGSNSKTVVLKSRDFRYFTDKGLTYVCYRGKLLVSRKCCTYVLLYVYCLTCCTVNVTVKPLR